MNVIPVASQDEAQLFCPECGYSLRGLAGDRCPECGHDIGQYRSAGSRIPWLRVRGVLHPIAFWKTVFLIVFWRCRWLYFETQQPLNFRHARLFSWLCGLHAWAGGWLLAPLVYDGDWWRNIRKTLRDFRDSLHEPDESLVLYLGLPVLTLIAALAISGVHTYFFETKTEGPVVRRRVVALSYLAAAPLAMFPVFVAIIFALVQPSMFGDPGHLQQCRLAFVAATGLTLLIWYAIMSQFASRLLRNPGRVWRVRLFWPLACVVVLAVIFAVLPALLALTAFASVNFFK